MAAVLTAEEWAIEPMTDSFSTTLLTAFRQLLRPLVRILLRHGVSYGAYAETTKRVFVEVAGKDFMGPDEESRNSRIAILTGLTRQEVDRVSDELSRGFPPSNSNLNRVGRILAGWHQDPEFTGPYGLPLELSVTGPTNSFESLIQRYCSEASADETLGELQRLGIVVQGISGRLRVLTRSYIPTESDPAAFQFMGVALRDLAETLDRNLDPQAEGGFFERRVWTPVGIDPQDMPEFDSLVHQNGQRFLEALDNYLTAKETDAEALPAADKVRVGVGVYMFSDASRSFKED
jgi:hypothetical protein